MRKRNNLTDEEKREIDVWKYKRKAYHITIPIIAQWSNYHPMYLYSVENHVYPMNDKLRNAYKKVLKAFARRIKPNVQYTKLSDK